MSAALRKIWAFLVRDFRQESSYRLHFVTQWSAILLNILVWYFLARFAGDVLTERLSAYGGDFFSFLLIGVALWGYQNTAVNALRNRIREAQTTGTLEALRFRWTPRCTTALGLRRPFRGRPGCRHEAHRRCPAPLRHG